MSGWWRRSLRFRLAVWAAGSGVAIVTALLMAALSTAIWQPQRRTDVIWALLVGLPAAALASALAGYAIAGRLLQSIRSMLERAKRLSASSLRERLPVGEQSGELAELATVFNDMLDRLDNSFAELKRFTADASHELRTPLTAIRAVGEVALVERDPRSLRAAIGSMLEESSRMMQLIERLLLLAQADSDVISTRIVATPVREVVADVSDTLSVVAAERGQRVELHDGGDISVLADPGLLRLALVNLVQNAIRYSPAGTSIRLRTSSTGGEAVIEVADQGPGIPPEHQARIFDRFYRIDKARARSDGGAGLGLAIVKWSVERMHGAVELESTVGRGSLFRLRMPMPGAARAAARTGPISAFAAHSAPEDRLAEPSGHAPRAGLPQSGSAFADSITLFVSPIEASDASAANVLSRLKVGVDGLAWDEARRRLERFGHNDVTSRRAPSWRASLWHSANNPFNGVLTLLGVVSLLTRDFRAAAIMGTMVVASTGLRFWQEWKSLVQAESLRRLVHNRVSVFRTGPSTLGPGEQRSLGHGVAEVPLEQLVPGDIVLLSAGHMVPGDLRLIDSRDLFVTQSALTGEALPVEKFHGPDTSDNTPAAAAVGIGPLDRRNLLFLGSSIISGTGTAVVLATGLRTYFGATSSKLVGARPPTAFDRGVNDVSWLLIRFMLVMVPIVFFINGLAKGRWLEAFFFAIAVAVGLTPEMLPMIVNATLARGAAALSRHKMIVKRLSAIQDLGAMDILCTDKTGTLTQDQVALIRHVDLHGVDSLRVLEHAYLNSAFQTGLRNLLDRAVVAHAANLGLGELAKSFRKIDEIPFDFTRRRMSVVLEQPSQINMLICKGAVDETLQICTQVEDGEHVLPMTPELRRMLGRLRDKLNDDGLRVVAVGYKALTGGARPLGVVDEDALRFSGFIAFLDPPKDSAAEALRLLRAHNVAVKILTGDSVAVARRTCREVGLEAERVVSGVDIEPLPDEPLGELAERTTVFAKLSPLQKSRIVEVLKARGHTVGFLGDGINDATALRAADVGISVDSGVDIAKEAADIILLEKSLLVLEYGVIEGRRTHANIVKYIKMAASSNFGNVLSVLVASAALPFLPMLPLQLLTQNLLYDFSQMSLPWDRVDREFLRRPRPWEAGSIARFMLCIGPISSIFDIAMFLILWFVFRANTLQLQSQFQSGWFVEALLTQTLIVHMIRTEKLPFVQSTAAPPVVLLTLTVVAFGIWLPFSPVATTLGFESLPASYFPWLGAIVVSYCALTQLAKLLYLRRFGDWL